MREVTFLIVSFSLVRKERKGQKEESIPLLNTFRRLAATGANIASEPSHYSITTVTGSKRSSADSDLLLCHVRLRRASRFRFGCGTGCKHSEIMVILIVSSAHLPYPRPRHPFFSGRADNACTNLLGFLVRYVRTRGSVRLRGAVKPTAFALPFAARTCHAWLARLTRARGRRFLRGWKILLNDFWYFWSLKSTIREKFIYASSRETNGLPY